MIPIQTKSGFWLSLSEKMKLHITISQPSRKLLVGAVALIELMSPIHAAAQISGEQLLQACNQAKLSEPIFTDDSVPINTAFCFGYLLGSHDTRNHITLNLGLRFEDGSRKQLLDGLDKLEDGCHHKDPNWIWSISERSSNYIDGASETEINSLPKFNAGRVALDLIDLDCIEQKK